MGISKGMRIRFWSVAVGFSAVVCVAATTATARSQPALSIRSIKPTVTIAGEHFRAREYVRATLSVDSVTRSRLVRASRLGALSVDLGALPESFDPCNDTFLVLARGRSGDEAMVKFVARQCPPKD